MTQTQLAIPDYISTSNKLTAEMKLFLSYFLSTENHTINGLLGIQEVLRVDVEILVSLFARFWDLSIIVMPHDGKMSGRHRLDVDNLKEYLEEEFEPETVYGFDDLEYETMEQPGWWNVYALEHSIRAQITEAVRVELFRNNYSADMLDVFWFLLCIGVKVNSNGFTFIGDHKDLKEEFEGNVTITSKSGEQIDCNLYDHGIRYVESLIAFNEEKFNEVKEEVTN